MGLYSRPIGDHAPVIPVLTAVPTDADFAEPPVNGTLVINAADAVRPLLFARVNGVWRNVTTPAV